MTFFCLCCRGINAMVALGLPPAITPIAAPTATGTRHTYNLRGVTDKTQAGKADRGLMTKVHLMPPTGGSCVTWTKLWSVAVVAGTRGGWSCVAQEGRWKLFSIVLLICSWPRPP